MNAPTRETLLVFPVALALVIGAAMFTVVCKGGGMNPRLRPLLRIALCLLLWGACLFFVTAASVSLPPAFLGNKLFPVACSAKEPSHLSAHLLERVLAYLVANEQKEIDPWLRDDVRIAWITVLEASRGNPEPHVTATRRALGIHPDELWPAIVARRKANLGREYCAWYDAEGNLRADAPKKPCVSVRPDAVAEKFVA